LFRIKNTYANQNQKKLNVSSLERIGDHSVKIARHVATNQSIHTISDTFEKTKENFFSFEND